MYSLATYQVPQNFSHYDELRHIPCSRMSASETNDRRGQSIRSDFNNTLNSAH